MTWSGLVRPSECAVTFYATCCSCRRNSGICRSGIGLAMKTRRIAVAMRRAHFAERWTRALSVAMPVFAYICRYNFEIKRNASRPLIDLVQTDRFHIERKL